MCIRDSDKGRTFRVITEKLTDAGYCVSSAILDSAYFGIPQSRSRIYIVGLRKDIYGECIVEFTKKRTEKTAFRPFVIHGDRSIPITKRWDEYIDYYLGIKTIDEMSFDVPRTRKSLERVAANCDLSDCAVSYTHLVLPFTDPSGQERRGWPKDFRIFL